MAVRLDGRDVRTEIDRIVSMVMNGGGWVGGGEGGAIGKVGGVGGEEWSVYSRREILKKIRK